MDTKIKAAYEHGKFGTFMFNVCARWTEFLCKHRWLYYLLACTWGILATFVGVLITAVLAFCKLCGVNIKFIKYYWVYGICVGPEYWGGMEMGLMFLRDHKSHHSLNAHEFGHTFQNCLFGPFFWFIVAIPSAVRYWYQTIREWKNLPNKPYDGMWFEDSATCCGEYVVKLLSKNEVK